MSSMRTEPGLYWLSDLTYTKHQEKGKLSTASRLFVSGRQSGCIFNGVLEGSFQQREVPLESSVEWYAQGSGGFLFMFVR